MKDELSGAHVCLFILFMSFLFVENQQLILYTSASFWNLVSLFSISNLADTELGERNREVPYKEAPPMLCPEG